MSVTLYCPSYSTPTWTKLGHAGIATQGDLPENIVYTVDGGVVVPIAAQRDSGVYFCNGTYRNGTFLYRVYLLYIGCKF